MCVKFKFLAKDALCRDEIGIHVTKPYSEIRSHIQNFYNTLWQVRWEASDKGRHLFPLKKQVIPASVFLFNTRREEIVFCRLRLGVARLNDFLYKIGKHVSGLCPMCLVKETVDHYLISCEQYAREREVMKQESRLTELSLVKLLQPNSMYAVCVLKYTQRTRMFNEL